MRRATVCAMVLAGCGSVPEPLLEPAAGGTEDKAFVHAGRVWPSGLIPVCWEQAGFETEKGWIREAAATSWEGESMVSFLGWEPCTDAFTGGLRLRLADSAGFTRGLGTELDNVEGGVNFNTWASALCVTGWTRERCVRATAVHELGHALGFAHEQNRGDTPETCAKAAQGGDGDATVGAWDLMSVMSYCNPERNGDGRLSGNDIWALQRFYGAPRAAAVTAHAGGLEVFVRGGDDALYGRRRSGSGWSGWQALGGQLASAPAVVAAGDRLDVFARGADGTLWHRWRTGASWSGWASLGGPVVGTPAAIARAPGRLDVFVRGTDGGLWRQSWNGTRWSGLINHGGRVVGTPAVASTGDRVEVFVRGSDNGVYQLSLDGDGAGGWIAHGGPVSASPAVAASGDRLDLVVRGADLALYHRGYDGAAWGAWRALGGQLTSDPEIVTAAGQLAIFARGADLGLTLGSLDHGVWRGWRSLGGVLSSGAVAASADGNLDVFFRGDDGGLFQQSSSGGGWSGLLPHGAFVR